MTCYKCGNRRDPLRERVGLFCRFCNGGMTGNHSGALWLWIGGSHVGVPA